MTESASATERTNVTESLTTIQIIDPVTNRNRSLFAFLLVFPSPSTVLHIHLVLFKIRVYAALSLAKIGNVADK